MSFSVSEHKEEHRRNPTSFGKSLHEKSHVLSHLELLHSSFVHVFPYANGLKCKKAQTEMTMRTAAICSRTLGRKVDVIRSNTPHNSRMAKYRAGK